MAATDAVVGSGIKGVTRASGAGAISPGATAAAGRPRSEQTHRAILDATLALLSEVGFAALTVEGVASRAGVGKATIYRRWASKLPLVVEAFDGLPGFEETDTGTLAGDLKAMLSGYLKNFLATPLATVYPSLAAERSHNPALGEVLDPVLVGRRRPLDAALERAVARGEIAADTDLEMASDLIVGPIAVRLFFRGARIHPAMVDDMVELALHGIKRASPTTAAADESTGKR